MMNPQINWDGHDEGPDAFVGAIVKHQLKMTDDLLADSETAVYPVLRGKDWNTQVIDELARNAEEGHTSGILYQGAEYAGGPPPGPGWE
jgi:hypothetical protein